MKRIILFSILIIITASFATSQNKIYIDIKTYIHEKTNFIPAKAGTTYFISQDAKLGIREIGENYSLWLKDYSSEQKGKNITINYIVELHSPAMIRQGRLIASERLSVHFSLDDSLDLEDVKIFEKFKNNMDKMSNELLLESFYCGSETVRILYNLLDKTN